MYLCTVTINGDFTKMKEIKYLNGSYCRANKIYPEDFGQDGNAIIIAKNEGWPFRGEPKDMARDAIRHINAEHGLEFALIPVINFCKQSIDDQGILLTEEVIFQVII